MKTLSILGVSGSIGQSTLRVLQQYPSTFQIEALTAHSNVDALIAAAKEFNPKFVAIGDERHKQTLFDGLKGLNIAIGYGEAGIIEAASRKADIIVCAISGAAALLPSFTAAKTGAILAMANKETIVCAGHLLKLELARAGGSLIPVDSEHSGLHRLLQGAPMENVDKLVLTASGGAFRDYTYKQLQNATPQQALNHPTWNMGGKITIDSATLMNKGLELIEACVLFDKQEHDVEVVIEPNSIIHALVKFKDGSITAEYALPDMALPIAAALFHPNRKIINDKQIDLVQMGAIQFYPPNHEFFPALKLARIAAREGRHLPIVFNAANEVAVEMFLNQKHNFLDISALVERTMNIYIQKNESVAIESLAHVLHIDAMAREFASQSNLTIPHPRV